MTFDWEKQLDYLNDSDVDFKKEFKDLQKEIKSQIPVQKESKETYNPLKVYEIKNIADIGFWASSQCSTEKDTLHFAVNGPLVGHDWEPVGWYIDGWSKKKDFVAPHPDPQKGWNFDVDNGIFWLWKDGKLQLIPYKEYWKSSPDFQRAFQNWPMLIHNGKNVRENSTSTSRYNRSWIWYTASWKAMVIYSDEPVTFKELAKLFVDRWCTNAIYLDWWPYAGYADPSGSYWKLHATAKKLQFFHQN